MYLGTRGLAGAQLQVSERIMKANIPAKHAMPSASAQKASSRPPPLHTKPPASGTKNPKMASTAQKATEKPSTPQTPSDRPAMPSLFAKMRAAGLAKVADRKLASGESQLQSVLDSGRKIDLNVFSAARTGSLNLLKQLVSTGQPIEVADESCRTPLHLAVAFGHGEVVEYLVECKANVSAQTRDNAWTPLHEVGTGEIAELLIVAQADVNAADAWGMTPLHTAAKRGNTGVLRCLTQYGADIRRTDDLGRTALHLGACHGHRGVVEELASLGADLDFRDGHGRSALDCARAFAHAELTQTLEEMRGLLGAMGAGGTSLRALPAGSPAKLTRGTNDKPAARPRTSSLTAPVDAPELLSSKTDLAASGGGSEAAKRSAAVQLLAVHD